jgi:uncharacterized protein (TIGR00725 family)
MKESLEIVGVMGSGRNPHSTLASQVADIIARLDCHLLTGAGEGVMAAVAAAFVGIPNRKGRSIGIVRASGFSTLSEGSRKWSAKALNANVEIAIKTHLPLSGIDGRDTLSRNHINVLSSDAIVIFPGDTGTMAELELAIEYQKPVVLFLGGGKLGNHAADQLVERFKPALHSAGTVDELEKLLREFLGK